MIHLVILAAGRGRRLGALGDDTPKWLLEVGEATLAERQLEAVDRVAQRSPELIRSVRVVVGHAAPAVERFVAKRRGPEIALVENPVYEELNNWYSLLLALRSLGEVGAAERIVVFNADLLAQPEWFARFICDSAATPFESLIAVDTSRPLTDESMKVSVAEAAGGDGPLLERIGKADVEEPAGEYVGMFMARASVRGRLAGMLEGFVGSETASDYWYEGAIGRTAAEGVPWVVWPTPDSEWIEIDDEGDYALALEMDGLR